MSERRGLPITPLARACTLAATLGCAAAIVLLVARRQWAMPNVLFIVAAACYLVALAPVTVPGWRTERVVGRDPRRYEATAITGVGVSLMFFGRAVDPQADSALAVVLTVAGAGLAVYSVWRLRRQQRR